MDTADCESTGPRGRAGGPVGIGFLRQGIWRGVSRHNLRLFRPFGRRLRLLLLRSLCSALLSALSRLRWFRFAFLALRLALGLLAVALRHFLVLPLGVLMCGGFVFAFFFRVRHIKTVLLN